MSPQIYYINFIFIFSLIKIKHNKIKLIFSNKRNDDDILNSSEQQQQELNRSVYLVARSNSKRSKSQSFNSLTLNNNSGGNSSRKLLTKKFSFSSFKQQKKTQIQPPPPPQSQLLIEEEHLNQNNKSKSESMNRLLDLPLASSIKMINWFKDLKIMRNNNNNKTTNTATIIDTDSGINSMNSSCNNSPTTENPPLPSSQSIELIQNEITKLTNQIAILPVDNHYESNSKF